MKYVILIVAAVACGKTAQKRGKDAGAAVEVVTTPALPDGGEKGAKTEEIEPNDGDDVATPIALGATARGKIDPDTDTDHYRIEVQAAGVLSVMVDPGETLDVTLDIEDASGNVIARSDRGAARVREGVPNLAVTPGRYYAVVAAKKPPPPPHKRGHKAPDPVKGIGGPYEITVAVAQPTGSVEREPDEDRGQANEVIIGDTVTGYIGWSGDSDVWKVSVETLSAKNTVDIELSAVEGVTLSVDILDGVGAPITTRKGPKGGGPLVIRGFVAQVPQSAPPYLYLVVKGDKSNPETAYQLRVSGKVMQADAELEPNDTPEKAMPLDRTQLNAHWSTGDVDCFAIAAEENARTLEASIDTPKDLDLAIDLLVDGKVIAKSDHPGKGAAERVSGAVPAGAHAVIRVRGSEAAGDGPYELKIVEGAAAP